MVIVNTVVSVRDRLGMTQQDVALTLAAYGFGSMAAAFILPRILDRIPDRRVMLLSAAILVAGLAAPAWISRIVTAGLNYRSERRSVGKEGVSTSGSRLAAVTLKKKKSY